MEKCRFSALTNLCGALLSADQLQNDFCSGKCGVFTDLKAAVKVRRFLCGMLVFLTGIVPPPPKKKEAISVEKNVRITVTIMARELHSVFGAWEASMVF
jgi:hypothetical protein